MRKKKNEIFIAIKDDILTNVKSYFIVIIIFTVGIFLGVLFINQTQDKTEIEKYINTYVDETKILQNGNYMAELQKDVKNNVILVLLLWFAGTTIIGIPIVLGIIIIRGFCLGYTIASCVFVLGKLKGIIFVLITIFLQNIIFIPALMILGVSSIKLYKSIVKDRRKENIKLSILKHSIVSFIIMLALIISSIIKIEVSYRLIVNLIKYF
ncbi:MAG: stage II sporulation protein M [Clostridia bacterium]